MTDFEFDSTPSPRTNQSAGVTDCRTCGGDRFVTVRLRSPEQTAWRKDRGIRPSTDSFHEEVAPCPDCNPIEVKYHTLAGPFRSMDPAQVRETLRR